MENFMAANILLRASGRSGAHARNLANRARAHDQDRRHDEYDHRVLHERDAGLGCAVGERERERDDVVPAKWQSRTAKQLGERYWCRAGHDLRPTRTSLCAARRTIS